MKDGGSGSYVIADSHVTTAGNLHELDETVGHLDPLSEPVAAHRAALMDTLLNGVDYWDRSESLQSTIAVSKGSSYDYARNGPASSNRNKASDHPIIIESSYLVSDPANYVVPNVYINGVKKPVTDLIGETDGHWDRIHLHDINSHGNIVGVGEYQPTDAQGNPTGSPEKRAFMLLKVDVVEREPDDGEVISSGGLYYESDPMPEIDLSLDSSEIDESGNLVISVSGEFKDRLSELIDAPEASYRVQNVSISCNGELLETIPMSYGGSGVMPWQPFTSENSFTRTYTITDPGPQTYTLRAETDANAVGNVGWDEVAVGLRNEEIINSEPAPSLNVSIAFNGELKEESIQSAQVYFGNRAPLPTDDTVTESSAASSSFTGTIEVNGSSRACEFRIFKAAAFDDEIVDRFSTEFSYTDENNEIVKAWGQWQETGDNTLRFYPIEFYHQSFSYNLQIAHTTELEGSPEGSVVPFVWRSTIFGDEVVEDEDSPIYLSDTQQAIHPFTFSPTYQYIVDNQRRGRPKIFLVTAEELPAALDYLKPSDVSSDGQLRFSIKKDASDEGLAPIEVSIVESDFGTWEPCGDDYSGAVTMPVLLTYFELLWGNPGLELLSYFQEAGGEVLLGDYLDNCDLDYWGVERPRIEIEEDKDPVWAANCLMEKLQESMRYYEVRSVIIESGNLALLEQSIQQQAQGAAEAGVAAANVYLAGFSLVNEGADWALAVTELSQGNYAASIAFLPFVPVGASYVIKRGDEVVESFSAQTVNAVRNALRTLNMDRARARLQRMGALDQLLEQGVITRQHMLAFYDSGLLKVSKSRSYAVLKENLGAKPALMLNPRAHHDLPLEFEREFIAAGLDPNNYGRWVPNGIHKQWHKGAGGGDFNADWADFFLSNPQATKDEILSFLDSMRSSYLLD